MVATDPATNVLAVLRLIDAEGLPVEADEPAIAFAAKLIVRVALRAMAGVATARSSAMVAVAWRVYRNGCCVGADLPVWQGSQARANARCLICR